MQYAIPVSFCLYYDRKTHTRDMDAACTQLLDTFLTSGWKVVNMCPYHAKDDIRGSERITQFDPTILAIVEGEKFPEVLKGKV